MFPWRSFLSIVTIALLSLLFVSQSGHKQIRHSINHVQRVQQKGASLKSFSARSPTIRDQLAYDAGLVKRDVCADAFPGRVSQTCSPSQTLCCIIPTGQLPQCTTILGYGFCCTEHTDCFVDLDTACGTTGASTCAAGLCCPAQTTCVSDFQYSNQTLVRCNVNRNLIPAGIASLASSSSSMSSTATASRSRTASGTRTSTTASSTTSAASSVSEPVSKKSLGGGAIAGIAIGAVAGVALLAALGFLFWRRGKQKKAAAAVVPPPAMSYNPVPQEPPAHEMSNDQVYEAPGAAGAGYYARQPVPKTRYANDGAPTQELGNEGQRHELP